MKIIDSIIMAMSLYDAQETVTISVYTDMLWIIKCTFDKSGMVKDYFTDFFNLIVDRAFQLVYRAL